MVAQNASHWKLELAQQRRDPLVTIAEIAHHQKPIGLQGRQQTVVGMVPSTVKISGDGDSQVSQHRMPRLLPSCIS
jgi:hypothetical protein